MNNFTQSSFLETLFLQIRANNGCTEAQSEYSRREKKVIRSQFDADISGLSMTLQLKLNTLTSSQLTRIKSRSIQKEVKKVLIKKTHELLLQIKQYPSILISYLQQQLTLLLDDPSLDSIDPSLMNKLHQLNIIHDFQRIASEIEGLSQTHIIKIIEITLIDSLIKRMDRNLIFCK